MSVTEDRQAEAAAPIAPATPAPPRRVTIREVAQAARVSTTTVSHVINDKPGARIGEDARRRVREAVTELGYRHNAVAAGLVRGRTRLIGLVADSIATTPFAGQIIRGAQDEAWRHGHVLLIADTGGNPGAEQEALAMMHAHQVGGVLYSTWYHREVEPLAALGEVDHVLVNCFASPDVRAVVPDEVGGGRAAAQLLLDHGHRRVVLLNTTTPSPARSGRAAGHRQALEQAGVARDDVVVLDAVPDQAGGFAAAAAVAGLVREHGVTGVCCHNDRVAMGLYDGLREHGLSVPDDVSVVGFDNQEVIAAHLRPGLTTVALPHYELGVRGVRALLDPDDWPPGTAGAPGRGQLRLECPPVVRASVAAPKEASWT